MVTHDSPTVPGETPQERRLAVITAGHRAGEHNHELLVTGLSDADPHVRASALRGLEKHSLLETASLVSALHDADPGVRQDAARITAERSAPGESEVLETLRLLLGDSIPLCVIEAIRALSASSDLESVPLLMELARTHGDQLVVEEATAALGELGDVRGLPVIVEMAEGKPALRRRVVAALGAFEGVKVEALLDQLGEDRDWQVRQAVAMLRKEPDDLFD